MPKPAQASLSESQLYNEALTASWQRLCEQLELDISHASATYTELLDCYSQPQRAYHGLQHLYECITLFKTASHLAHQPAQLELALWFHDAIYAPRQADNEQRSADWAENFLQCCGVNPIMIGQVTNLVMATWHHQASNADEQLMVDIDLAILGSTPERFAQYQQQIRAEYDFVPPALYAVKRSEVLAGFYQRPRIYQTEYFYSHYEQQARHNLQLALANCDH